ncbi:cation:proton antiporter [Candidatus Absconditicoccus praedator]|nr:cation:proton antiporter [Candidatus Absconditicoccus praedator]
MAGESVAFTFFALAIILIFSKLGGLVEKIGFPSVLGQLLAGVVLGNLFLVGIDFFEPIKENPLLMFLSQLGVLILLFQIGLESEIGQMKRVGIKAINVALVGVILPFVLGYFTSMRLLPDDGIATWLFLGAAFTATSVGITMSVFKDNNMVQSKEGQIVLGAAVIDDVLGLLILAIITAIVADPTGGLNFMEIGSIILQAFVFLFGAIVLGQLLEGPISKAFAKISTGLGMKFTIVISFCLIFAYLADLAGLDPIIGAFAAGLILDPVYFKYYKDIHVVNDMKSYVDSVDLKKEDKDRFDNILKSHERRNLEDLIEPIGMMLIPLFFVMTGMQLDLTVFSDLSVVALSLILTVLAFLGKYLSGFVATGMNKHVVGLGMTPRGEVGLVFASIGLGMGAISNEVFGIIIIVVILTTFIAPVILNNLLKKGACDNC